MTSLRVEKVHRFGQKNQMGAYAGWIGKPQAFSRVADAVVARSTWHSLKL